MHHNYCQRLTPNGCDCAGCCDVFDALGRAKRVRILGGCTSKDLDNPLKCPACERIDGCSKPCGRCDLCLGKWNLRSDCTEAEKATCAAERCDAKTACPCEKYCLTGCCVAVP